MNTTIASNDPRLLELIGHSGIRAVGIYFLILAEMRRLNCATLTREKWSRVLSTASVLDRELTIGQIESIIDRIVETDLLVADDPEALTLCSPELEIEFEKSARKSEVTRAAAKKRWAT